jgi:hypothetical protein
VTICVRAHKSTDQHRLPHRPRCVGSTGRLVGSHFVPAVGDRGLKMSRAEYRKKVEEALRLYERGALTKEQVEQIARHFQLSRQLEWDTEGRWWTS